MKNLFSIGELSKLQNISRQTLIFYDKIGLSVLHILILITVTAITVPASLTIWIRFAS